MEKQTPQDNAACAALRRAKERAEQELGTLKAQQQQWQDSQAELSDLRKLRDRTAVEKDIASIKAVYPEFSATGLDDLPKDFIHIMATGRVDAVTAYEILAAAKKRGTAAPPPTVGEVNAAVETPKEYYTPQEVDRLTRADFKKDPSLLARIQKSMTKWR